MAKIKDKVKTWLHWIKIISDPFLFYLVLSYAVMKLHTMNMKTVYEHYTPAWKLEGLLTRLRPLEHVRAASSEGEGGGGEFMILESCSGM